mmetsp:Transcript_36472/g.65232  ORF Transcript_36472/g.65232 Transcript_36472/m.65232 type:complete len:207 (-) Transcript_36472:29-649(-)
MDVLFWEKFYEAKCFSGSHDCYCSAADLQALLMPLLRPTDKVVHLGCGNSTLGPELYDLGVQDIVNIDFCAPVVAEMQARYMDRPKMQWKVMDTTALDLGTGTVHVVLDKGTLDAMLCAYSGLVEARQAVDTMRQEVQRVLAAGGHWIVISHSGPEQREALVTGPEGVGQGTAWAAYNCTPVCLPKDGQEGNTYFAHVLVRAGAEG